MGARDDVEARLGGARLLNDLAGFKAVRDRNDQMIGLAKIGALEDLRLRRVANDNLRAGFAEHDDCLLRVLHDDERPVAVVQRLRHEAADATISDKDGVARQATDEWLAPLGCRRDRHLRPASPWATRQIPLLDPRSKSRRQPVDRRENEGVGKDRKDGASEDQVLATQSAKPKTRPASTDQPSRHARPNPISVAIAVWPIAPGMAVALTDSRSLSEK